MTHSNPWSLSPEAIARFHRDGYLVVLDLLSSDEVEAFLQDNEDVFAGRRQTGLTHHLENETWARMAGHPRITAVLRALMRGQPMCVQTMMLAKAPGGKGIAIHQDGYYIETEPDTSNEPEIMIACWIALDAAGPDNGGLCVVPGSHQGPLLQFDRPQDSAQHVSWVHEYEYRNRAGKTWMVPLHSAEVRDWDPAREVLLTVPAGGGVFFTGRTIHGSHRNESPDRPRRAFACHYVRDGTWVYRTDIQRLMRV